MRDVTETMGEVWSFLAMITYLFTLFVLLPLAFLNQVFNFMSGKVIAYMLLIPLFIICGPLIIGILIYPFLWLRELRCSHVWEDVSDCERVCSKCGKREAIDCPEDYRSHPVYFR